MKKLFLILSLFAIGCGPVEHTAGEISSGGVEYADGVLTNHNEYLVYVRGVRVKYEYGELTDFIIGLPPSKSYRPKGRHNYYIQDFHGADIGFIKLGPH